MASYLRPRRGKKSTAESQALVLKRGEVFFECPDTGVGTGAGKIKVGDGSTAYSSLPYFLEQTNVENSTIGFTDSSSATASSNNATYLTNIKPANSLKTIFTNLKQLLYNYNSQLTSLNNDRLVRKYIPNTDNLDDYKTIGVYSYTGRYNITSGFLNYGIMVVLNPEGGYIVQVIFNEVYGGKIIYRGTRNSGTLWSDWITLHNV
jgi:hypothetical protein